MQKSVVLVVEDDPILRMYAVDEIAGAGFTVIEAADADEAIAILTDRPEIHVVFTDIEMPGSMDGLRLAAFVRDRWPPIQIIVTSGHVAVDKQMLPPDALFLPKPPQWPIVIDAIHRFTAA